MAEPGYSFGTPARGVLLGLRPAQAAGALLGLGLAGAALVVGAPLPVAALAVAAAGAWCWARAGERQVHEWTGPALRHTTAICGGRTWRAEWPSVIEAGSPQRRSSKPAHPRELEGLRVTEVNAGGMAVGLATARSHAGVVVLRLRGPEGFLLCEPEEQTALVAGWSRVLAGLGTSSPALRRFCWVERAEPAPDDSGADAGAPGSGPVADSAALGALIRRHGVRHEVYLGLEVEARRAALSEVAVGAAGRVADLLAGAGITAQPLAAPGLSGLIRRWSGPTPPSGTGTDAAVAGGFVVGRQLGWSEVRVDGSWHRSWVVRAWPASPVGPAWLEPLLAAVPAGVARSFAVHFRPLPPALAARRARAGRLNAALDQAQRARWGFDIGARQDAELAEATRREEELVAGAAAHRVIAVLAVSAATHDTLETAAKAVEQSARTVGLDIACCYGSQADGWAATLPLCRVREARGS